MRLFPPYRQGLYIRRDKWPPSISSLLLHLRVNNDVLERPTILRSELLYSTLFFGRGVGLFLLGH